MICEYSYVWRCFELKIVAKALLTRSTGNNVPRILINYSINFWSVQWDCSPRERRVESVDGGIMGL